MSTYPIIQSALNGGEVSEEIARRTDIDKYFSSVSLLRNMYCRPQGGVRNRTGFKFISDATVTEDTIRLIPFSFSTTQAYILEFTIGQMRVYKNKGLVTTTVGGATVPYVVSDNRITKDFINNMYVCQVADILYVAYGGRPITITRYGDTDWRIEYYNYKNGPVGPSVGRGWITNESGYCFLTSNDITFSQADINRQIRLKVFIQSDVISRTITSSTAKEKVEEKRLFCGGDFFLKTNGTWQGNFAILTSEDGIHFKQYKTFASVGTSNYDYTADFSETPCVIKIDLGGLETFSETGLGITVTTSNFNYYINAKITNIREENKVQLADFVLKGFVGSESDHLNGVIYKTVESAVNLDTSTETSCSRQYYADSTSTIVYSMLQSPKAGGISFSVNKSTLGAWTAKVIISTFYNEVWTEQQVFANVSNGQYTADFNSDFTKVKIEIQATLAGFVETLELTGIKVVGSVAGMITDTGLLSLGNWHNTQWPRTVGIYQDRLVWGANYTIDATKTGEYEDFSISSPLLDTDAISTNLRDESVEHINAILGGRRLIAFTETSDFVHSGDVFSPTDFVLQKHGYNGGLAVKPIAQFNRIIYATKTNDIRDLAYNLEDDGYSGENISILAHHLFEGKTVKDMQFQKTPDSLIYFLMTDGTINVLSYLKEQNVVGWSHYDVKDGSIKSIACLHTATGTQTWVAVKRDSSYTVELLSERSEGIYLDCSKKINHITGIDTYIVPHLAGKTVSALVDGNVVHDIEIPASGVLPVEFADNIILGYPYDAEVATVPLNHIMRGYPSTQVILKNPVEVHIFYKDSRGGVVKQTSYEEEELIQATPDSIDTHIQPHTGIYKTPLNSIHEEEAKISIMQKDPLPLHITTLAIITDIGG